jgi:hypothetical protein
MEADDLAAFLSDDAVYLNIPLAPVTGRRAIAANISTFIRPGPPGIGPSSFARARSTLGGTISTWTSSPA